MPFQRENSDKMTKMSMTTGFKIDSIEKLFIKKKINNQSFKLFFIQNILSFLSFLSFLGVYSSISS